MLFAMAASVLVAGVAFGPGTTHRYSAPRSWTVIQIESPVAQFIVGTCVALVGAVLFYLGYKALQHERRPNGER